MEVPVKHYFARNDIVEAVLTGMSNLLIGGIARYIISKDKQCALGIIVDVMLGKLVRFTDGTASNIYLRCEEFNVTGQTKIVRVSLTRISNNQPQPTDIGYEFMRFDKLPNDWISLQRIRFVVIKWMSEIETEWSLYSNNTSTVDLGSPYSSYSDEYD